MLKSKLNVLTITKVIAITFTLSSSFFNDSAKAQDIGLEILRATGYGICLSKGYSEDYCARKFEVNQSPSSSNYRQSQPNYRQSQPNYYSPTYVNPSPRKRTLRENQVTSPDPAYCSWDC